MTSRLVALTIAALLIQGCAWQDKSTLPAASAGLARMHAVNEELIPVAETVARLREIDEEMHAPLTASLSQQTTPMLIDMFKASDLLVFYAQLTDRALVLQQLSRMADIYDVLERRDAVDDALAMTLFQAYVSARALRAAGRLVERRPFLRQAALPAIRFDDDFDASLPAILAASSDGAYVASNVALRTGRRIIAVVGGPISEDMVEALTHDPMLASQLGDAAILWVLPADRLDAAIIGRWNNRFPGQPMVVAYENTAWGPVTFDSMPDVFFLRDGELVARISGWDPDSTLVELKHALDAFQHPAAG